MKLNKTMMKKTTFKGEIHKFKSREDFFENAEKIQFQDGDLIALRNRAKLYLVKF